MKQSYQNKKWLQEEINRLGTSAAVAKEYGWGKNTIARWVKRLDISYPEKKFIPEKDYQRREWLEEKLLECGTVAAIARKYGYSSTTLSTYIHRYKLTEKAVGLTKIGQKIASETYKDKYWMERAMEEFGSAKAVANAYGFGETTIQKWAKHFGVNHPSTNPDEAIYKNKNWLTNQYEQGRTPSQIAEQVGVSVHTIAVQNKLFGIKPREILSKVYYPYKEKKWIENQYLLHGSGNAIANHTGYPVTSINRYLRKYGFRANQLKEKTKVVVNHNFFEVIDTEEKAYWLGFMLADGFVMTKKTGKRNISTVGLKLQEKDAHHVLRFRKSTESNVRVKEVKGKRKGKIHLAREIQFVSDKMGEDLFHLGIIPNKTGKERIPENRIPSEYMNHFVRGYFDGDGSASNGVFKVCCSFFLYEQLKDILISIGISMDAIYRNSIPGTELLCVYRKEEVKKIARWMYRDATLCLERKKQIYKEKGFLQ